MCLTTNMNFIRSQARCSIEVLLLDYKVVVAQTVLLGPGSSLSTHGITCFRCRCRDLNDLNTWFLQIFRDSPWELQLLWQRMQSCCQRCNHWKWLVWSLCCYAVVVVFAPHTVSLKHETWVDRTEALKAEYLDSEFCASCPFTALLSICQPHPNGIKNQIWNPKVDKTHICCGQACRSVGVARFAPKSSMDVTLTQLLASFMPVTATVQLLSLDLIEREGLFFEIPVQTWFNTIHVHHLEEKTTVGPSWTHTKMMGELSSIKAMCG